MRRLAHAPAVAVLAAAFAALAALGGPACGSKKEPPAPQPAGSGEAAAAPARPTGKTPAPAPVPAPATAAGKLPGACDDYRATIERLAQCGEGIPQATRDALRTNFERDWAGWQQTGSAQAELEAACQRASDNVKVAASAACGW